MESESIDSEEPFITREKIKERLLKGIIKNYYHAEANVFTPKYLKALEAGILNCRYLDINNLKVYFEE